MWFLETWNVLEFSHYIFGTMLSPGCLQLLEILEISWNLIEAPGKFTAKLLCLYDTCKENFIFFTLHLQTFQILYMHLILCGSSYHCTRNADQARSK